MSIHINIFCVFCFIFLKANSETLKLVQYETYDIKCLSPARTSEYPTQCSVMTNVAYPIYGYGKCINGNAQIVYNCKTSSCNDINCQTQTYLLDQCDNSREAYSCSVETHDNINYVQYFDTNCFGYTFPFNFTQKVGRFQGRNVECVNNGINVNDNGVVKSIKFGECVIFDNHGYKFTKCDNSSNSNTFSLFVVLFIILLSTA